MDRIEEKPQGSIRTVSLPPLRAVFLSTFDFSRLKSLQKSPERKKPQNPLPDLSSRFPTSVLHKVAMLTFGGGNAFTPKITEIVSSTQSSRNSPLIYYPLDQGIERLKKSPDKKFSKRQAIKKNIKHSYLKTKPRFFSKPRHTCEISLQTNDIELLSIS